MQFAQRLRRSCISLKTVVPNRSNNSIFTCIFINNEQVLVCRLRDAFR